MVQRVTYRRRNGWNTKSNKVKVVKTPGGRLTVQYTTKKAGTPKCGDCHNKLFGVAGVRPYALRRLKNRQRTVSRAYGGSRCASCVRSRIMRAFLIEEQKIVKDVLRSKKTEAAPKKDAASAKKTKSKSKARK